MMHNDGMPNDFGDADPLDILADTLRELAAWIFTPERVDWRDDPDAVERYERTGQYRGKG